ncbi:DDHD domain-containing protein [Sporodiniella umbellata]|nr:DDHD domain-containing protein [Sporodiniella umbellata]
MFFETTFVPSSPSLSDTPSGKFILVCLCVCSKRRSRKDMYVDDLDDVLSDLGQDVEAPVDHLIFVIHGIGQQTEQYGQFYQHIENFQETTRQVLQAKVPDHDVRIELIPIEWHKHIHENVDPLMKKITLKSIPTIRLIENEYLSDVLFYFSKDKGQQIIQHVTHLFNNAYQSFMKKHPYFDGKIVILGYSLGGVITWDILSHQRSLVNEKEKEMYQKVDFGCPKLLFKPDYFFGLGSPISAVLTIRSQDPRWYHPEHSIQFENIYHPFDPLGYRFEPLFDDSYIDQPAITVQRSVPIGPSFLFPSLPTYASFSSFFSWKQEEKALDAKEEESSNGFMTSFFQYFSREDSSTLNKPKEDELIAHIKQEESESIDRLFLPRHRSFSLPRSQTVDFGEETYTIKIPLKKSLTDHSLTGKKAHHRVEVLTPDDTPTALSERWTVKEPVKVTQENPLPGGRRLDYVLQPESVISMIANEYLIGLRAHFSYWTNKDFVWHMLCQIEQLNRDTRGEAVC